MNGVAGARVARGALPRAQGAVSQAQVGLSPARAFLNVCVLTSRSCYHLQQLYFVEQIGRVSSCICSNQNNSVTHISEVSRLPPVTFHVLLTELLEAKLQLTVVIVVKRYKNPISRNTPSPCDAV